MSEENNKVIEFQAVQEERVADLQEEKKTEEKLQPAGQERKDHLRKWMIFAVVLAIFMSGWSIFAFNVGKKSVRDEANAKVAKLEQKLQKEYIDKKYALLEEQYEIFTLLKEDRIWLCIEKIQWNHGKFLELGDDALDNLVLADVGYPSDLPSQIKKMNDEKALEYIDTLKKIVEKYPYSNDINQNVIYRMESFEESFGEEIQNAETFEAIDALKKQCEANIALWEIE